MQTAMETVKQGLGIKPTNLLQNVNVTKMHEIRDAIKADPYQAKVKYHINCVADRDLKVIAEMNRFELGRNTYKHSTTFKEYFDQPKQVLGLDSAPSPTEHLLSALGGCLTMSLLKVAACESIALSSVICKVKGKVDLRSAFSDEFQDVMPGLKAVCAKFEIQGVENLDRSRLNQLIQMAQRNSVVTQTLKRGTPVCVCLKGEERAFEIQHGLKEEEAVRGREGISPQREWGASPQRGQYVERQREVPAHERQPGFVEKAKEAVEVGKERVSQALETGKEKTQETLGYGVGTRGEGASPLRSPGRTSDIGTTAKTSEVAGRPFDDATIGRYSQSKLDEGGQLPIGSEMKEPGALKEKQAFESGVTGVGPAGRISSDVSGLGEAKKETTR